MKISTLSRCPAMTVLVKKERQDNTILNNAPGVLPCLLSSHTVGQGCGQLGWFFSLGITFPSSSLTLTFAHSHLRLLQASTGIVTCSQAEPASGTFGSLSELAVPVHHPAHWRSVQYALLHGQWHRVTLYSEGEWLPATATMLIWWWKHPESLIRDWFLAA